MKLERELSTKKLIIKTHVEEEDDNTQHEQHEQHENELNQHEVCSARKEEIGYMQSRTI